LSSCRGEGRGEEPFQTGIIYFARDHESGLAPTSDFRPPTSDPHTLHSALSALQSLEARRDSLRQGARVIDSWQACRDTVSLWTAVSSEWSARHAPTRTDYNLWLTAEGEIKTNLSLFDQRSTSTGRSRRILKDQAAQLHQLHGRRPMELVLQRSQREL